jgi:hypothetical protein
VHRGDVTTSLLVIEAVEQAAADHGVKRVGVAIEPGGVGHRERYVDSGVLGPLLGVLKAVGEMSSPVTV